MFLKTFSKLTLALAITTAFAGTVHAEEKVRIGLLMPLTGTYASVGDAVIKGMKQYIRENGGTIAGKKVDFFTIDDESNAAKAAENATKLIKRDKVDLLIGTVHSGVTLNMAKVARDNKKIMIIPVAGANDLTGSLCSPYVFRTSYSNWQISYATGKVVVDKGLKTAASLTWDYAYGQESAQAFKDRFESGGGKVVKDFKLKFPDVDFKPHIEEIAKIKPDAVFVALAGAGSAKFVADYRELGLLGKIPLYSNGYLTESNISSIGGGADGIITTYNYADGLNNEKNKKFRSQFSSYYKMTPDGPAVNGYDLMALYAEGLKASNGDPKNTQAIIKGMENAKIESPRGTFTMSKAHNPVEDIYLREVKGNENVFIGVAEKALADPAIGCNMPN